MKSNFFTVAHLSPYDSIRLTPLASIYYFQKTKSFVFYFGSCGHHFYSILKTPRSGKRIGFVNWKQIFTEYSFMRCKQSALHTYRLFEHEMSDENDTSKAEFFQGLIQCVKDMNFARIRSTQSFRDIICDKQPLSAITLKFITDNSV